MKRNYVKNRILHEKVKNHFYRGFHATDGDETTAKTAIGKEDELPLELGFNPHDDNEPFLVAYPEDYDDTNEYIAFLLDKQIKEIKSMRRMLLFFVVLTIISISVTIIAGVIIGLARVA